MGLTSQLIPILFCLLVCTGNFVYSYKCRIALKETINSLNLLTEKKNATKDEIFCRAATVLSRVHTHNRHLTKHLRGLNRSISSMTNVTYCPVNEVRKSTLKDFLERLNTIMKEKYSKCESLTF
ncbi:interleukin-4 [Orycteropus afer afer]|uniref:Interleukin-4 n=1 Tax=Orycteropus afer afer TaxID=1230840 RepID=A0A8B7A213_ORYAF|nr:interleukin-4 [Orycteropus afer afer]